MDFYGVLDQVLALLRQRGRVSYRALKRQFDLDDAYLDDLKVEIIEVQQWAVDQDGTMLIWTGDTASAAAPEPVQAQAPLAYTPPYLAEKVLTSRSALEGERKQVTVLFADLKGSTELIRDLDPEVAQHLLDPALQAAEFLYETSLFPERVYTFKHALTHEVAYSRLLQERRRVLHARIVEALEALAGDRLDDQVERLALHALRGEVWQKALAEELGMRPLQAHCYLGLGTLHGKAGQREQARTELSAAITLYRAMDMTFWLPQAEATLARVEG
jgi:hypothetical protein